MGRAYDMPMSRRTFLRLAGLGAGVAGLPACGSSSLDQIAAQSGTDAYNTRDITLSWWGNDPRHQYMLEGIDLFEKKHPDIYVTPSYGVWNGYERRYHILMMSSNETDVMQINYAWLRRYSEDGTGYYDLNDLRDVIDLSNFEESDLSCGMRGDHLNALPIAYNTTVFLYNKDIYDRYDLAYPTSWDELFAAAETMRGDGVYPTGTIYKQLILAVNAWYEQTTGNKIFTGEGKYAADAAAMADILTFIQRVFDEKVMANPNDFDSNAFAGDTIAGVMCWASDVTRYIESAEGAGVTIELGDFLSADGSEQGGWYVKPATMYAISKLTASPEDAAALMDFLLNDPDFALLQGNEKGVPVSASALKALRDADALTGLEWEAGDAIHRGLGSMEMINPLLEDEDVQKAISDACDKCYFGRSTIEAAAAELNDALAKVTEADE